MVSSGHISHTCREQSGAQSFVLSAALMQTHLLYRYQPSPLNAGRSERMAREIPYDAVVICADRIAR